MKLNRKLLALVLIALSVSVSLCGCGSKGAKKPTLTPQPHGTEHNSVSNVDDEFGDNASVNVLSTVAYYLPGDTAMLYGATEYENNGDCPVTITSAKFTFSVDDTDVVCEFEPPAARYCIVYPGERTYLCAWHEYDASTPSVVTMRSAEIACQKSLESRVLLSVDNPYIVQNYPDFVSVSGTIHGTKDQPDCALNLIYVGIYDNEGVLIGVWYFTENSQIKANIDQSFTTHLRGLQIEGLIDKAHEINMVGYAFN